MTQTAAVLECDLQAAGADLQRAVLANLTGRRSIRRYLPRPLAEAEVEEILHAIVWAPSAHNRQPVRVIRLEAMPWKTRLAQAMGERLRADRLRDGDCAELVEQDVRRSFARITGAPLVLVLCMDMSPRTIIPMRAARMRNGRWRPKASRPRPRTAYWPRMPSGLAPAGCADRCFVRRQLSRR